MDNVARDRFYVVCHIPNLISDLPKFTTILTGEAANIDAPDKLTDKLENGERLENRRWSELSAMYKIWKEGPKSHNVGFCHYRRYLNFSHPDLVDDINVISRDDLFALREYLAYDRASYLTSVKNIIVSRERTFHDSVFTCYSEWHNSQDYLEVYKIVNTKYPEIGKIMSRHFENRTLYTCNIFFMQWHLFDSLCSFWFDVLFSFTKTVLWPRDSGQYQDRDTAFLSERLFDAWLRHKTSLGYKLLELPILFIK